MRRLLLAFPLLVGCGEGFFVAHETCDTDYLDWAGGLTHHLLQGPGDGTFDYDPQGIVESRLAGGYDLATGDFGWTTTYNPDHWRATQVVTGFGYAKTDGDLDVQYTVATTDVLGDETSYEVRERRVGCAVTRRYDFGSETDWHFGTFADGAYTYRDESTYEGDPWIVEGTLLADLSWTETLDFSQPGFSYAYTMTGDADGYSREDFEQTDGGTEFVGYTESFLDGSQHVHYTVDAAGTSAIGTWDYTTDYEGDGSGTYVEGSTNCTLTFTDGNCRYNCGGSDTGNC